MVSTILLDQSDCYIDKDGNLPRRPDFDKELLTTLCKNQIVSEEGYILLPPSIRDVVTMTAKIEPTMAITIPEIDALADLLIVVRNSSGCMNGKKFRLDKFKQITKQGELELWMRL